MDFFEQKSHKIVPSAPIVVQNDPTLMFTNAGMNQFKDIFLGDRKPAAKRVADTQKCLRVSGKHNDLEEVGFDTYHHTMFEMLGNWSFGDYFKKEAIEWAWELLTKEFGLDADRMYVTVFEGDKSESLAADEESRAFWATQISEDRILNGSKKDNFWEMGDTGPCGPCSEIHIDLRSDSDRKKVSGKELVNMDHPQVVEVWNLVFIQFNRLSNGSLENLPQKHVDTGMGFERLAMAIQAKESNYDTDVFQPIIQEVAQMAGVEYGVDKQKDIAIRVIADHIRAISFTIADGQLPGNVKAGYVVRRILRRAVRYGYSFLGMNAPFLNELVPKLVSQFGDIFTELFDQKDFVQKVIKEEELTFLRTLDKGLLLIEGLIKESESVKIKGDSIFKLYDTYGFPKDLSLLILRERDLESRLSENWEKEFDTLKSEQQNRSKVASEQDAGDWIQVLESESDSEFLGYEQLEAESRIVKYRKIVEKKSTFFQLVLDKTPFYAESGGQVGDSGVFIQNGAKTVVFDTKKEHDLIVHFTKDLPKDLSMSVNSSVAKDRRSKTENNHSSTHLLHAALREVLGEHVQQRGSLVNDKILRFDFSHFAKMSEEEISRVEQIVNLRIRQNILLDERRNVPIETAKEMGAMALFGEKYGSEVRVITFDSDYSVELCGGTHVPATGKIGLLKITSESSVAAGVRRIEAVTAEAAENFVNENLQLIESVRQILKHPKDLAQSVKNLVEEKSSLTKKVERYELERLKNLTTELKDRVEVINGLNTIFYEGSFASGDAVKQIAFDLKRQIENLILVIGGNVDDKPNLTVMLSDNLVEENDLNAVDVIRSVSSHIKGGGGGQSFYATAGGKDLSGLSEAVQAAKKLLLDV